MGVSHRIVGTLAFLALLAACSAPDGSQSIVGPGVTATPAGSPVLPAAVTGNQSYEPDIDPAQFVSEVTNPYFPLPVGARWEYRGRGDSEGETETVEVLAETRTVMGVECTVVRDVVSVDGQPLEVTRDFYAQDEAGNVWYFGEETAEYDDGEVVSTSGSWEAGVDGAQPGILMPADPPIGLPYRQEFYAGEAEDMGEIVELGTSVDLPNGTFDNVLVTEDWTPLEPHLRERKFYAHSVGLVMEETIEGGDAGLELIMYKLP